jgi:hypothetical protein
MVERETSVYVRALAANITAPLIITAADIGDGCQLLATA